MTLVGDSGHGYIGGGQGARLHWWGTGGKVTLEGDRGQGYIGGGQGANPPEADESLTHARQKSPLGCALLEFYSAFLFCVHPLLPTSFNKVKISLLLFLPSHTHSHTE